ncbi:MAG TPA: thioredoxin-like domain-containing protein [Phycisphaerae bacterium]|nr:thioredoxin-like domain-containing protein [Phycisphaerae bacterium]
MNLPLFPRWRILVIPCIIVVLAVAALFRGTASAQMEPSQMSVRAPEFPPEAAWFNTDKPLRFGHELKGQVVLLDFWTYCCINCMHVLPDLEYLERKYKDQPVVIIGVHSNKFENEGLLPMIRAAVQRYNVHHPVVVDPNHKIWDGFAVNSWPTLVLIGADGRLIGQVSGEGHRELLDQAISRALADAKAKHTLADAPLKLAKEGTVPAASGLSFPAKALADAVNKRLFIVDSNHNRIVVTTWPTDTGSISVEQIIGSGEQGAADGNFAAATFHHPQGAALGGGANTVLYVADTENHMIRRVDLQKQTVTTILGTGKQDFDPEAGKSGRQQGLNSPWDVAVAGNRLYISNAGQHQIFAMNLMTGMTEVAAGSGRENIRDGEALEAQLAQTSQLALDSATQTLYFADSETSSIRSLDLQKKQVHTLIGHGLFDFGDIDGNAQQARFQHPIGLSLDSDGKSLLIADTYNHKIRRIDLATTTVTSIAGTGRPGTATADGQLQLFEPTAVVPLSGTSDLLIADTNNHRLLRLNPQTHTWKELTLDGLSPPKAATPPDIQNPGGY